MQPLKTEQVRDSSMVEAGTDLQAAITDLKGATEAHRATGWEDSETREAVVSALLTIARVVRARQHGVHCAEGTLGGSIVYGWAAGLGVFGTGMLLEALNTLWIRPDSGTDIDMTALVQVLATCLAGSAKATIHNLERRLLEQAEDADRPDPDTPRPSGIPRAPRKRPPRKGAGRAKVPFPERVDDPGRGSQVVEDDGKGPPDPVGPAHDAAE
jgi:hypothetical protein